MSKLEYLFKQFETILGWYKQSEEKAKFLVGLNTLVVGVVNGLVFVGADKMRAVQGVYSVPIWLLLGLSGVALVASTGFFSSRKDTRTPMSGTIRSSLLSIPIRTLTVVLERSAVGMMAITCEGIFQSG